MRLRLFDRLRWLLWQGSARLRGRVAGWRPAASQSVPAGGRHRRADRSPPVTPVRAETAAAQVPGNGPFASPVQEARARPVSKPSRSAKPGRDSPGRGGSRRVGAARAAVRGAPRSAAPATIAARAAQARAAEAARHAAAAQASDAHNAWYEAAEARKVAVGHRDCGPLEKVLHRDWAEGTVPPPEVVRSIDRLAELPRTVSTRLADGVDAIHVGPGGVPDLDGLLTGRTLASWTGEANGPFPGACAATVSTGTGATG